MADDMMSGGMDPWQQIAVDGFAALWRGETPTGEDLTDDPAAADAMVAAGRLVLDDGGTVIGVHGLAAHPTRHRIVHDAGTIHTWCALDAIGIPAALGIDAEAITSCPSCEAELRVPVRRGEPINAAEPRLWLPGGHCEHLVDDFCAHANLYCDSDHLSAVVPADAAGRVLDVSEVVAIGRESWSDVAASVAGGEGD